MSSEPSDKPKIIVDDDWKERVQAEKESLKKQPAPDAEQPRAQAAAGQIPPASFSLLVTSLATQTLAALGQIRGPEDEEPVVHLDVARHHIDMLGMLEEKTKGNLSAEESSMLSSVVHELRMIFIAAQSKPDAAS